MFTNCVKRSEERPETDNGVKVLIKVKWASIRDSIFILTGGDFLFSEYEEDFEARRGRNKMGKLMKKDRLMIK